MTGFEAKSETGDERAPEQAQPDNQQVVHLLLRDGVPRRPGPHDRTAGRVRILARLRAQAHSRLVGQTAFARPEPPAIPWSVVRSGSTRRGRKRVLALPEDRRRGQLRARYVSRGDQLWSTGRRTTICSATWSASRRGGRETGRPGQATEPFAPLLAPDRGMPRPDRGTGWKGLRLRPDIVGTTDGLAKYPTSASRGESGRSSRSWRNMSDSRPAQERPDAGSHGRGVPRLGGGWAATGSTSTPAAAATTTLT